jgi:hypothetical protein
MEAKRELRIQERLLQSSGTTKPSCDEDSENIDSTLWASISDINVTVGTVSIDENPAVSRCDVGKAVSMRNIFSSSNNASNLSHIDEEISPPYRNRLYHQRSPPVRSKSGRFRRDNAIATDTPPSRCKSALTFSTVSDENVGGVPFSPSSFLSPKGGFFSRKTPARLQSCKEESGRYTKGALDRIAVIQLATSIASPQKGSKQ